MPVKETEIPWPALIRMSAAACLAIVLLGSARRYLQHWHAIKLGYPGCIKGGGVILFNPINFRQTCVWGRGCGALSIMFSIV